METTAFIFPGQGSQQVGMGAELQAARPEVFDRYLELADAASGLAIRKLCLEGPQDDLTRTEVAQPALFAVSLALDRLAREAGLVPDFVAGHSLGEYTAAVAAGALGLEDGMQLVSQRGRLMADVQSQRPGAMAAIIGLDADRVGRLCVTAARNGVLGVANLNSPKQVVVSGGQDAVDRFLELAEEVGARRAIRLPVGAAFHSELMKPVQERLAAKMKTLSWRDLDMPLASNASGALITRGEDVRDALIAQIASPVRWVDCVNALVRAGCQDFVELGPGRVLSGLVRAIDPAVQTHCADSPAQLAAIGERAA